MENELVISKPSPKKIMGTLIHDQEILRQERKQQVKLPDTKIKVGLGWLPDLPDFRDLTVESEYIPSRVRLAKTEQSSIKSMIQQIGVQKTLKSLPGTVDLKKWCPPVENQGSIGSCTANAGAGLIEYFEKRAFGTHLDASRLFLYKATRNLLHWTGDTGAYLRTTMGAMALFGVPPEEYWPYETSDYDQEPSAFCYSFAQNYQSIQYFRLDKLVETKDDRKELLNRIKTFLAFGLPSMFGFTVFSSINQADSDGKIPFPGTRERVLGGHAVVAVGYDDNLKITNTISGKETKGALLIRNSWGTQWGNQGYGFIPYDYVLQGLAIDWWSLLKQEWVDTNNFGLN